MRRPSATDAREPIGVASVSQCKLLSSMMCHVSFLEGSRATCREPCRRRPRLAGKNRVLGVREYSTGQLHNTMAICTRAIVSGIGTRSC